MAGHHNRSVLGCGGVVERSLVVPTGSRVESPGPCVAFDDREPGPGVPVRPNLSLRLSHQGGGHARSSMMSRDVHLLDFIVDNHYESGDGSLDGGYRRVADSGRRPRPKRILGPSLEQFLRGELEMAIPPTEVPDFGDVSRILRTGRP